MNDQITSYRFFSSLFFNLPDKAFVEGILSYSFDTDAPGMDLIKKYVKSAREKSIDDILTEISVDRTYLLHGLYTKGPRPPYESVYAQASQQEMLLDLNRLYRTYGFRLSGEVSQPADYIGTELAFMEELCKQGEKSYEIRKEFFTKHIGKWGSLFAQEMINFARTDFYRGIGYLLNSFLEEEADLFQVFQN